MPTKPTPCNGFRRFIGKCFGLDALYYESTNPYTGFKLASYSTATGSALFTDVHADDLPALRAELDAVGVPYRWIQNPTVSPFFNVHLLDIAL